MSMPPLQTDTGAHFISLNAGGLSPASAPHGMQSPMSPAVFAPPVGPHTRGARPAAAQANPWSSAASNPFPHQGTHNGAQIGYYGQPQVAPLASHPPIHYDRDSSSFTIPASGGGQSPLPDDSFLPVGSARKTYGSSKKGIIQWLRLRLLNKAGRPTRTTVIVVGALLTALLLLFIMIKMRSTKGLPTYKPATSAQRRGYENTPAPPPPIITTQATVTPSSRVRSGEDAVAKAAGDGTAKRSAAAVARAGIFDKGLAEIRKLKENLKAMKIKLKEQLAEKSRGAQERARLAMGGKNLPSGVAADDKGNEPIAAVAEDTEAAAVEQELAEAEKVEREMLAFQKMALEAAEKGEAGGEDAKGADKDGGKTSGTNVDYSHKRYAGDASRKKDAEGGYFDYFVSDWSPCSVTCGSGTQTRSVICQHTKTGKRVDMDVCIKEEQPPEDQRVCHMNPCPTSPVLSTFTDKSALLPTDEEAASQASTTLPSQMALVWPTLAQYMPDWAAVENDDDAAAAAAAAAAEGEDGAVDAEPESSCPASRWGRDFITSQWAYQDTEVQCLVDVNSDEHASVELVRFPSDNLPQLAVAGMSPEAITKSQITDSFIKIRHALFHPSGARYTAGASKQEKEAKTVTTAHGGKKVVVEDEDSDAAPSTSTASTDSFGLSLDCTAMPSLLDRAHRDPAAATFLRSMRFLNPQAPPLVTPDDPNSKSIFTRAFERMTDREFESTTFFIHRNCRAPYSAAQCMPDLFALYSVAQALKVEFATIRVVFLDDGDESPWLPAWQKLAGEGQVFTKAQWADLRVAPFDEEDVYVTNAVFLIPSASMTLFALGENVFPMPLESDPQELYDAFEAQTCSGRSALHVAFNHLMADVFLGFGSHAASDMYRAQAIRAHLRKNTDATERDVEEAVEHAAMQPHHAPPVLVVAQGGGGVQLPAPSQVEKDEFDEPIHLIRSGKKVANLPSVLSAVADAFPTLRVHTFPSAQGFSTQLTLLTHATVLLSVRHSVALNVLPFVSHPQNLHVIDARPVSETQEPMEKRAKKLRSTSAEGVAEALLDLPVTQGMNFANAVGKGAKNGDLHSIVPASHAIFSARWMCERLGCASFTELVVPETSSNTDTLQLHPDVMIEALAALQPPVHGLAAPMVGGTSPATKNAAALAEAARRHAEEDAAEKARRNQPLVEYKPKPEELAAAQREAAKAKAKHMARAAKAAEESQAARAAAAAAAMAAYHHPPASQRTDPAASAHGHSHAAKAGAAPTRQSGTTVNLARPAETMVSAAKKLKGRLKARTAGRG